MGRDQHETRRGWSTLFCALQGVEANVSLSSSLGFSSCFLYTLDACCFCVPVPREVWPSPSLMTESRIVYADGMNGSLSRVFSNSTRPTSRFKKRSRVKRLKRRPLPLQEVKKAQEPVVWAVRVAAVGLGRDEVGERTGGERNGVGKR